MVKQKEKAPKVSLSVSHAACPGEKERDERTCALPGERECS